MQKGFDYIGVAAAAIVHDGKGRILLMKRGKGARDEHGRWDICGGSVKFGESLLEAVKRELMEELAAEPEELVFIKSYGVHRKIDGRANHWVQNLHAAKVNPKKLRLNEPEVFDEIGWFGLSDLPEPHHSQLHHALDAAKKIDIVK